MRNFLTHFLLIFCFLSSLKAQPPFELKTPADLSIAGTCIALGTSSFFIHQNDSNLTETDIQALDFQDISKFDRKATQNWSPVMAHLSDAGLLLCVVSPSLLFISPEVRNDASVFTVMTAENILSTLALTLFTKTTVRRIRPYVYNSQVPIEEKFKPDAKRSFFSGHTSLAFCSAVFTSTVFSKYHPDSPLRPWIWSSSLVLASGVGYLRFAAGKHFPTDIIVGAIVGSAVGYAIPKLHQMKSKKQPQDRVFAFSFYIPL